MPALTGKVPGAGTSTLSYTIPTSGLDVESVYATIDATAAGGAVTAEITITDQSGAVIAAKPQSTTIPAGVTGSATWALQLDDDGGLSSAYDLVQDEGVALPQETTLDFVGAGVAATDDAANGRTIITVPGQSYAPSNWATVTKTANESVTNSTVRQNDDELFFATVNGGVYDIECFVIYSCGAAGTTPGLIIGFGEDTTPRGVYLTRHYQLTGVVTAAARSFQTDDPQTARGEVTNYVYMIHGWYVAGGGTFRCQWAQANVSASATTVKSGSVLAYNQIA